MDDQPRCTDYHTAPVRAVLEAFGLALVFLVQKVPCHTSLCNVAYYVFVGSIFSNPSTKPLRITGDIPNILVHCFGVMSFAAPCLTMTKSKVARIEPFL